MMAKSKVGADKPDPKKGNKVEPGYQTPPPGKRQPQQTPKRK